MRLSMGWLAAKIFEEAISRLTKGGRTSGVKESA
jgi:hypothetical protein